MTHEQDEDSFVSERGQKEKLSQGVGLPFLLTKVEQGQSVEKKVGPRGGFRDSCEFVYTSWQNGRDYDPSLCRLVENTGSNVRPFASTEGTFCEDLSDPELWFCGGKGYSSSLVESKHVTVSRNKELIGVVRGSIFFFFF